MHTGVGTGHRDLVSGLNAGDGKLQGMEEVFPVYFKFEKTGLGEKCRGDP